jgi:hypothetical protein
MNHHHLRKSPSYSAGQIAVEKMQQRMLRRRDYQGRVVRESERVFNRAHRNEVSEARSADADSSRGELVPNPLGAPAREASGRAGWLE